MEQAICEKKHGKLHSVSDVSLTCPCLKPKFDLHISDRCLALGSNSGPTSAAQVSAIISMLYRQTTSFYR
jgi:hypothetical protein